MSRLTISINTLVLHILLLHKQTESFFSLKCFNTCNIKIKETEAEREGERASLRVMRHYLWSARCNTVSANFTQKWQEINCNTLLRQD